jgi:hypothetical protein
MTWNRWNKSSFRHCERDPKQMAEIVGNGVAQHLPRLTPPELASIRLDGSRRRPE